MYRFFIEFYKKKKKWKLHAYKYIFKCKNILIKFKVSTIVYSHITPKKNSRFCKISFFYFKIQIFTTRNHIIFENSKNFIEYLTSMYTHTHTQNNTHNIVKLKNSSFCSEFKLRFFNLLLVVAINQNHLNIFFTNHK
jgi:hypothetical protein